METAHIGLRDLALRVGRLEVVIFGDLGAVHNLLQDTLEALQSTLQDTVGGELNQMSVIMLLVS